MLSYRQFSLTNHLPESSYFIQGVKLKRFTGMKNPKLKMGKKSKCVNPLGIIIHCGTLALPIGGTALSYDGLQVSLP